MGTGMHLRQRLQRRVLHRIQSIKALVQFAIAFFSSYRLAEFLPLTPLLFCLCLLSLLPDWVLVKADQAAEWALFILLGGKRADLRDPSGQPTGKSCLFSVAGALDPDYTLPDKRLLVVPTTESDKELAFPSKHAAGWGNATFLGLCMKLAYEDWEVVRDVVNHEWRIDQEDVASMGGRQRTYLRPRFVKGCSFHFMKPAGVESSEELSHIHLDSDACLIAVENPYLPAGSAGVALVLAFRGTEPLELSDFQSDFDAVPEAGEWGSLHPGFLLALGLDPNLNPYHQTLTTYTALKGDTPQSAVIAGKPTTPYEVLRDQINEYMLENPAARLYVTGHSLGGALAVVFMGALMHDVGKAAAAAKARVGALYTFGQPRVGDYEFLCHLQVSLLEPAEGKTATAAAATAGKSTSGSEAQAPAAANPATSAHSSSSSSSSKLKGLFGKQQQQQQQQQQIDQPGGPPLTSRYIRVVNTYDIVPHIPPTLCNIYQHGGDLLYLQMVPGHIKWLTEQPMFFISGIWTSSLYKLYHFGGVKLGFIKNWKGSDNYLRFGMRIGSVLLPFLVAGLNDHLPGDYLQQVANSDPAAWQPFRARKKLSRWAKAVMFTNALSSAAASTRALGSAGAGSVAGAAAAASTADTAATGSSGVMGGLFGGWGGGSGSSAHSTLSSALQARLLHHSEAAAAPGASSGGSSKACNGAGTGASVKAVTFAADQRPVGDTVSDVPAKSNSAAAAATKLWSRSSAAAAAAAANKS